MNVDRLNDLFQQAATAEEGAAVLRMCNAAQLRALCDLNHVDTEGAPNVLISRLTADRFGY